jgi:hypothetical protein
MKHNNSIKSLAISTFAFIMLFGFGMTAANAQGRYDGGYDQGRYGRDDDQVRWNKDRTRQFAYLLGYHNAYSEGRDLAERGYHGNFKDVQAVFWPGWAIAMITATDIAEVMKMVSKTHKANAPDVMTVMMWNEFLAAT